MHGAYLHSPSRLNVVVLNVEKSLPLSLGVQDTMYESIAALYTDGVQHRSSCSCRGAAVLFNHANIN